ncbi:MAG: ketopantoate reductase family protein [Clostridium butyricum]|nr:ketopantoate reductase family protein [Clostridium butyricum]
MMKIRRVSIVGMGALGILYGNFFAKTLGKNAVNFIADKERVYKYQNEDIFCNNEKCDFHIIDGSVSTEKADLLIFAVKSTALLDAIKTVKNQVGENTIILSVLNGITSEEIIGNAFGKEHMLYCVAQGMDAVKLGNKLTYSHIGQLCIGNLEDEAEKLEMLEAVMNLFDEISLPYTREENIKHRLYSKWMLNVGVNQVVMVNKGTYKTVQEEGKPREMMKAAMREVIAIAQKEHVSVTEEDLNSYVALIDTLDPSGMPSMRQDGALKRYSEVELFAGTVIKKAEKYGLEVPVNKELYMEVQKLESNY